MELVTKIILVFHIVAGFSSLVLFWVPVFTRKGGANHRKVGRYYVYGMWLVVVTALLLSIKNLIIANYVMAAFLGFLSLITAKPLWLGIETLKSKKTVSVRFRKGQIVMNSFVVMCGLALIAYGVALGGEGVAIFMFVFGAIGVSNTPELVQTLRQSSGNNEWFKDHLANMISTGIAAHTAFLAFGAKALISGVFTSYWSMVPWLAPTVVGTIGIRVAVSVYRKKGRIAV